MRFYVGTVAIHDGHRKYREFVCIKANNERQAKAWLEHEAAHLWGGTGEKLPDGAFRYESGAYVASPAEVSEINAVTFEVLSQLHKVLGGGAGSQLEDEAMPERVRTLALRIGRQLSKLDAKVPHTKLLHAVAASLGESDWQVLVHSTSAEPQAPQATDEQGSGWTANSGAQPYIPGSGYLWRVPVTVDASMTAFVKVRARDKEEAMSLARRFAADGNARFEVDEGNYRSLADHYIGDNSDDAVHRLPDDEPALPESVSAGDLSVQVGAYRVSLADLDDGPDALFWADLDVFDSNLEDPDDALEVSSCLSACPVDATSQERRQFCSRIAELFHRTVPEPSALSQWDVQHVFTQAVQGAQDDAAFAALETKLKSLVRKAE